MSPTTAFICARATRMGSFRMVTTMRLGQSAHPSKATYRQYVYSPPPDEPAHRRRERHTAPCDRAGRGAPGDPLPRVPRARLLLAPSAARAGGGRLPGDRTRHAWLRAELGATGDRGLRR